MANETILNNVSNVRPRQVLLVGLGGVGCRTVDKILSIMPTGYKNYTKAIAVDTDLEDLSKQLKYIPPENRIALGSNPDNGQSVTVGEYIRNNPDTMKWFVKGGHLDTIKRRNTAQGAKQIRMVSRIALAATNEFCGMKKTLEDILQDMNKADGTTLSQGLLVMIVCSVAGGTGAGTVLSFPLYLEQALSKTFSDEDVQIECSMLLPNVFSRAQDPENQSAARANAYAVIREIMSLNSGRLKRGDILPDCDFEEKSENISPYGRILFFDDVSMSGDSIEQNLDKVYVPKTAKAINEYLFGPVSGKITSALDNTLARVYRTGGAAIFSSVGTAKLEYPRATYVQYVTGQWVKKAIAENWTDPDKQVNEVYRNMMRTAIENGTKKPQEKDKHKLYCDVIEGKTDAFYKELKQSYFGEVPGASVALAEEFWRNCEKHLRNKVIGDPAVKTSMDQMANDINDKVDGATLIESLDKVGKSVEGVLSYGYQYEIDVMRPIETSNPGFYSRDKDEKHLYTYIKSKKLHPIMIRYFLYKLYERAQMAAKMDSGVIIDKSTISTDKVSRRELRERVNQEQNNAIQRGQNQIVTNFAKYFVKDLEEYIKEIEDMFKSLTMVLDYFEDSSKRSVGELVASDPKTGSVLAGGPLSMMYSWKLVEQQMSDGDDSYTIDPELNLKLHEVVYKSFVSQVTGENDDQSPDGVSIRLRTRYESIVSRELQIYYAKLLRDSYSACFPANVLEAASLECGLKNAYNDNKSRAEIPSRYTVDYFMKHGGSPVNYRTDAEAPEGFESDAEYLDALLAASVANSKPYCGRVDDNDGEKGILNRLVVANEKILRTKVDTHNVNELGVAGEEYIEDEFIDGVSTSRVGSVNVNTKFISSGISGDEMLFVTTLAGLQPFNFVAFLPPDDDEHAPTKAKSYYMSYREHIDSVAVRNDYITPHLHRDWHLADKLEDLTDDYTNTYNKDAAEAFAYGFIFNVIRIDRNGIVEIGKFNEDYFAKSLDESGIKSFKLLEDSVLADIENLKGQEKRDTFNSILVKIFELLATSHPIRDSIIAYAKNIIEEYSLTKKADFIRMCLEDEEISNISYNCILDIFDGYYQGTRRLRYNERDRAKKNTGYMFNIVLEQIFNMCKMFSDDPAKIKALYCDMVGKLYNDACCDNQAESSGQTENVLSDLDDIDKLIMQTVDNSLGSNDKLFTEGHAYSQKNAKDMIDYFINK